MRTHLLWLLLAACSSAPKEASQPGNTATGSAPGSAPAATDTACSIDADCVVVETKCCDHCNGGAAVAFNKASADAHKATGCEQTMCTRMACGAVTASCQAGVCQATTSQLTP